MGYAETSLCADQVLEIAIVLLKMMRLKEESFRPDDFVVPHRMRLLLGVGRDGF
jgi:hypothetical protein